MSVKKNDTAGSKALVKVPNSSFRRKLESSKINKFWIPDQVRHDEQGTFYETAGSREPAFVDNDRAACDKMTGFSFEISIPQEISDLYRFFFQLDKEKYLYYWINLFIIKPLVENEPN